MEKNGDGEKISMEKKFQWKTISMVKKMVILEHVNIGMHLNILN